MRALCSAVVAAVLWAAGATAMAEPVGSAITYQGQLNATGVPVSGDHAMVFRLFDAATGGDQVGPTLTFDGLGGNPPPVSVAGGLFTVGLDFGASAYDGQERYLEITVEGTTLTPRQRLAAAPYARYAARAGAPWIPDEFGSVWLEEPSGRVGIGTDNPHAKLHVQNGEMLFGNTGDNKNWSLGYFEPGNYFYLEEGNVGRHLTVANGGNVGIGTTNPGAKFQVDDGAVRIRNNADNKNWEFAYDAAGNYFYLDEFGVGRHIRVANGGTIGLGTAPDTSAIPFGTTIAGRDGLRVFTFFGDDRPATAIHAEVTGDRGGQGVYGRADTRYHNSQPNPPQPSYGLRGYSFNFNTVDFPDLDDGTNVDSFGVLGEVELSTGIWPGGSGLWAGVIGRDLAAFGTNTYGVYSDGAFAATGTKAFQIDHPLDPENKILNHYCAEGPEPLNVYSGTIVTDHTGTAWVRLPDYFEAINRDPRYQLTVIGTFAQAIIGNELGASGAAGGAGNRFSIRTSQPNVKVSWEVKAVRNDRFVQQHGAPVEVNKGGTHRGKFLSPQLYGQPKEMSMFHHPAPAVGSTAAGGGR